MPLNGEHFDPISGNTTIRKGYDVKALRTIVRMRKQDANEREQETILETYMHALGML